MIVVKVSKDNQLHGPVFMCDICQERILHTGNVFWLVNSRGDPVNGQVWHLHKQCARSFEIVQEKDGPGSKWYSDELSNFVVYLGENLGIQNWEDAIDRARTLTD